jgi:nitrite reductase/ring-hydroxylating ferredoxin subunit
MKLSNLLLVVSLCVADAFSPMGVTTRRSTMTMKRGRSFKKESSSPLDGSGMASGRNWINVPSKTVKDLPNEEGQVVLLETNAPFLVDKGTNPKGAVSVMKYGPDTYCFSSSCPQCKIPMSKAKALPPNEETDDMVPRVVCDFCKATFNLKSGKSVTAQEGKGFLGSLAKAVLSAQDSAPLKIYQLGEKNGKILFSAD